MPNEYLEKTTNNSIGSLGDTKTKIETPYLGHTFLIEIDTQPTRPTSTTGNQRLRENRVLMMMKVSMMTMRMMTMMRVTTRSTTGIIMRMITFCIINPMTMGTIKNMENIAILV